MALMSEIDCLPVLTMVNGVCMRFSDTMVASPDALVTALPKGITKSYSVLSRASLRLGSLMALNTTSKPASLAADFMRSTPIPTISPESLSM